MIKLVGGMIDHNSNNGLSGGLLCCATDSHQHDVVPTILIVDHDAAVRDSLAISLTANGYNAQAFASAGQFLASVPTIRPSCLLVELDLEDMMGPVLVGKLIERRIELPAIIMSARLRNPALERRLPPGIVGYLQKPFGQDELMLRIQAVLDYLD